MAVGEASGDIERHHSSWVGGFMVRSRQCGSRGGLARATPAEIACGAAPDVPPANAPSWRPRRTCRAPKERVRSETGTSRPPKYSVCRRAGRPGRGSSECFLPPDVPRTDPPSCWAYRTCREIHASRFFARRTSRARIERVVFPAGRPGDGRTEFRDAPDVPRAKRASEIGDRHVPEPPTPRWPASGTSGALAHRVRWRPAPAARRSHRFVRIEGEFSGRPSGSDGREASFWSGERFGERGH